MSFLLLFPSPSFLPATLSSYLPIGIPAINLSSAYGRPTVRGSKNEGVVRLHHFLKSRRRATSPREPRGTPHVVKKVPLPKPCDLSGNAGTPRQEAWAALCPRILPR